MISQGKFVIGAIAAAGFAGTPCALCGAGAANAAAQQIEGSQLADTATVRLHISGMTCGSCTTTARIALEKLNGVIDAKVTLKDSLGVVRYDPRKVAPVQITEHLTRLTGYGARVVAQPVDTARRPGE